MIIGPVTFTIKGTPMPWQRAARGGGHTFNTKEHEAYKRHAAVCAFMAVRDQIRGPWPLVGRRHVVVARMYFPDLCTRDDDNVEKMLKDSLKGVLWDDDSWTRFFSVTKTMHLDPANPRCEVEVTSYPTDLQHPPKRIRLPKLPTTKRGR